MIRYQGAVSAALVLGGVDATGPHLHAVSVSSAVSSAPNTLFLLLFSQQMILWIESQDAAHCKSLFRCYEFYLRQRKHWTTLIQLG